MYKYLTIIILLLILLTACDTASTPAGSEDQPQEDQTAGETANSESDAGSLTLATTTSTYDSGLLDAILPAFEEESGIKVEVVAVGTGQALALGEQGDADVLLVHARAREDAFMNEGHGIRREDVMYNDFVIVGPEGDPAGVAGMESAPDALAAIAAAESTFVSRGDDSGTHTKEKSIWEQAGIEPEGDWYEAIGQGMGATLTFANEELGYTLSDRATYLSRSVDDEGFELAILVEGDPVLFNPYGVMAVNPEKSDLINAAAASQFIDWLVSVPVQELIADFGTDKFGSSLFTPDSEAWQAAQ